MENSRCFRTGAVVVIAMCIAGCDNYDSIIPKNTCAEHLPVAKQLSRLRANMETSAAGEIESIQFHPNPETNDPRVRNEDLDFLGGLSSLKTLWLQASDARLKGLRIINTFPNLQDLSIIIVDDSDVENIMDCQKLTNLDVRGPLTSAGLLRLVELKQLKSLAIKGTRLADDVTCINRLERLEELSFRDEPITDQMMQDLRPSFERISALRIHSGKITDDGAKSLSGVKKLKLVSILYSEIGDESIEYLSTIPTIESLSVCHTLVSDKSVDTLATMPYLKELFIYKTKMSEEGIQRLRQLKPKLNVSFIFPT